MTTPFTSHSKQFICDRCETSTMRGQDFLEFRKGADLQDLDLLGRGALNFMHFDCKQVRVLELETSAVARTIDRTATRRGRVDLK